MTQTSGRTSAVSAILVHLLFPGLGHLLWGELLFGLFVFMIVLIGLVLLVVSLLVPLAPLAQLLLLGLPALFYLVSFVDLVRTRNRKLGAYTISSRRFTVCLLAGLLFQLLAPIAPLNFAWHNRPELFRLESSLAPLHERGAWLRASRIAYFLNMTVLQKSILLHAPERGDLVRFSTRESRALVGLVVGMNGEVLEIVDGVVVADGVALPAEGHLDLLNGNYPPTEVPALAVGIVTLRLGTVDTLYTIPLDKVIGKVLPLLP